VRRIEIHHGTATDLFFFFDLFTSSIHVHTYTCNVIARHSAGSGAVCETTGGCAAVSEVEASARFFGSVVTSADILEIRL